MERNIEQEVREAEAHFQERKRKGVILVGIDVPFSDLAIFLVKLALASIPATLVIGSFWRVVQEVLEVLMR